MVGAYWKVECKWLQVPHLVWHGMTLDAASKLEVEMSSGAGGPGGYGDVVMTARLEVRDWGLLGYFPNGAEQTI